MNQRSLHCLPTREGKKEEMKYQFSAPYFSTRFIRVLSSVSDQGDFIREGRGFLERSFDLRFFLGILFFNVDFCVRDLFLVNDDDDNKFFFVFFCFKVVFEFDFDFLDGKFLFVLFLFLL